MRGALLIEHLARGDTAAAAAEAEMVSAEGGVDGDEARTAVWLATERGCGADALRAILPACRLTREEASVFASAAARRGLVDEMLIFAAAAGEGFDAGAAYAECVAAAEPDAAAKLALMTRGKAETRTAAVMAGLNMRPDLLSDLRAAGPKGAVESGVAAALKIISKRQSWEGEDAPEDWWSQEEIDEAAARRMERLAKAEWLSMTSDALKNDTEMPKQSQVLRKKRM